MRRFPEAIIEADYDYEVRVVHINRPRDDMERALPSLGHLSLTNGVQDSLDTFEGEGMALEERARRPAVDTAMTRLREEWPE